jgi:hypothetical protein
MINYTREKDLPGILAFIDFEKAFDTVSWNFMNKCLTTMGFGNYFITCIQTLYTDIETCITSSGNLSPFFTPTRGIRQGCPISANLFIIIVEALACAIRENDMIEGISINGKIFKLCQYADDTVLYLKNQESLQAALLTLELFRKCSGLKMNRDKSEAVWIGASLNFKHKPYGLKWTSDKVKTLGIYISTDQNKMIQENYNEKINKIENLLKIWCLRKLTLKGKILIINTLIVPQILYVATVLDTPKWVITKCNELIIKFLWNNKPSKIKYKGLISEIEEGGLKLQDIGTKVKAIRYKWIQKIIDNKINKPWKEYVAEKFKGDIKMLPVYNLNVQDYPNIADNFYKSIFTMWSDIHFKQPEECEDVTKQIIWFNSLIKIGKKTVNYNNWINGKINFLQDLLNDEGKIATKAQIENKYQIQSRFLEYESLIHAIPKKWKETIINDNRSVHFKCFIDFTFKINNINKKLVDIKTKEIYWELINKIKERPTSEESWKSKSELDLKTEEWKVIYKMAYRLTKDTKLINFNFKITHRILAVGQQLHKWKINKDDKCKECNSIDTIEHYLVQCPIVLEFWYSIFTWWKNMTQIQFPILAYEIIFGIPNESKENIIDNFNFIILCGNYYVYRKKQRSESLDTYEFLIECKNRLTVESKIMEGRSKIEKFDKTWGELKDMLDIN